MQNEIFYILKKLKKKKKSKILTDRITNSKYILLLNNGKYNDEQIVPQEWIAEMTKLQVETPDYYKPDRVFPKIGGGYFTFISRDNYVFRDGSNGQYIILNKDKNLLITIMSTEKEMSKITEIFRDIL